jgi:hypothetical protein
VKIVEAMVVRAAHEDAGKALVSNHFGDFVVVIPVAALHIRTHVAGYERNT